MGHAEARTEFVTCSVSSTHRQRRQRVDVGDHVDDGWTVCTADGMASAHFEHTVLITRDGPEILTWRGKTQLK